MKNNIIYNLLIICTTDVSQTSKMQNVRYENSLKLKLKRNELSHKHTK